MTDKRDRTAACYLRGLGDTPDAVAESLERLGCLGQIESSLACPLARYAEDCLRLTGPEVDGFVIETAGGDEIELPPACREFVSKFDQGCYPKLVRS